MIGRGEMSEERESGEPARAAREGNDYAGWSALARAN